MPGKSSEANAYKNMCNIKRINVIFAVGTLYGTWQCLITNTIVEVAHS